MKITDVEAILISIPLRIPTSMSDKTVTVREYVVTRVRTEEGITGSAYTLGGAVVLTAVNDTLKPLVMRQDPFDTERLWDKMYRTTLTVGRKGAVIRALSTIDIALWDIKGRALENPLYKLLGAYTDKVIGSKDVARQMYKQVLEKYNAKREKIPEPIIGLSGINSLKRLTE